MKEIFVSHSSENKTFVERLRADLGADKCIVDCADFKPAEKSADEIKRWFDECKIFVLLLSLAALKSNWVQHEIILAQNRFYSPNRKGFRFLPYIIDDSVKHDNPDIPDWIRDEECFNLKSFKSPVVLSHHILSAHRDLIWEQNEFLSKIEKVFVGRKRELSEFENKANSFLHPHINAAIISGRTSSGKKTFARHCIINELKESLSFEPYKITMREKDGVENFILQLNDFLCHGKNSVEQALASSPDEKVDHAVALANELFAHKGYLFITDKMGCVGYNGKLTDWFSSFITRKSLVSELKIFILSEIQWKLSEMQKYDNIVSINIKPLNHDERKILLNQYCKIYGISNLTDEDVHQITGSLKYSPAQIRYVVESIRNKPLLKNKIVRQLCEEADSQIKVTLSNFLGDSLAIDLLLILSKYEFLSFRTLLKIFYDRTDDLADTLFEMSDFNIVEEFGASDAYIRLDSAVADYMQRSKFKASDEVLDIADSLLTDMVQESNELEDMSMYFIQQKENLESQLRGKDKLKILVPSVAIKYVINLYYRERYKLVSEICERLLSDMYNSFPKVKRELVYWLCLSYARLGEKNKMFEKIDNLGNTDKWFIMGFYFRKEGDYDKAQEYLEKTYKNYGDTNKVRRELVAVYLKKGDIESALMLAVQNYKNNPNNVFHIQAYFECLDAKPIRNKADIDMQKRLMSEMKSSNAKTAESMYEVMREQFTEC